MECELHSKCHQNVDAQRHLLAGIRGQVEHEHRQKGYSNAWKYLSKNIQTLMDIN